MYAVIVSGGKQHRVVEGETLKLEKIEVVTGETIDFDQVLMVADGDDIKLGAPLVAGGKVTAEVISHGRHKKVKIIKFSTPTQTETLSVLLIHICELRRSI